MLVGEQHDQGPHHRLQARVIAGLKSEKLAVSLEMVTHDDQDKLDRFNKGDIDVDGLFTALNWDKTWGHASDLYRAVFEAGRLAGARFHGVNAPRDLVRRLAKQGVENLSAEDQAALPELDLSDKVHRDKIEAIFNEHHPPTNASAADRFYAAQVLWDESMADGSARVLDDSGPLVILAGNGHVAGYRGIYQRFLRRKPNALLLSIVPVNLEESQTLEELAEAWLDEGDIVAIHRPREVLSL